MLKNIFLAIFLFLALCSLALAEEQVGVKSNGVTFNIASDRKIIKVGGVYQPEELDSYMKRRFDDIQIQLQQIQQSQKEIKERIQNIEFSSSKAKTSISDAAPSTQPAL